MHTDVDFFAAGVFVLFCFLFVSLVAFFSSRTYLVLFNDFNLSVKLILSMDCFPDCFLVSH